MAAVIQYQSGVVPPLEEILRVYAASGMHCPVGDAERIARMFAAASLVIGARDGDRLVGLCRALTDFSFCCYLSELAVVPQYQKQGIGRQMIAMVRDAIGDECSLMVLAAKGAMGYYQDAGFETIQNGFIIRRMR